MFIIYNIFLYLLKINKFNIFIYIYIWNFEIIKKNFIIDNIIISILFILIFIIYINIVNILNYIYIYLFYVILFYLFI